MSVKSKALKFNEHTTTTKAKLGISNVVVSFLPIFKTLMRVCASASGEEKLFTNTLITYDE